MKTAIFVVALMAVAASAQNQYVWDLLAPPLSAEEVQVLLQNAVPGETFPIYNEPPETSFSCDQVNGPGYYADVEAGCQVIRRCTINGDMVSMLCPNGTLFDNAVLTCGWWFNVDCPKQPELYDFANPRIYDQNAQLHDTPPEDYVPPYFREQQPSK